MANTHAFFSGVGIDGAADWYDDQLNCFHLLTPQQDRSIPR